MLLELRSSSSIAADIVSKVVDGCIKQLDLVRIIFTQKLLIAADFLTTSVCYDCSSSFRKWYITLVINDPLRCPTRLRNIRSSYSKSSISPSLASTISCHLVHSFSSLP